MRFQQPRGITTRYPYSFLSSSGYSLMLPHLSCTIQNGLEEPPMLVSKIAFWGLLLSTWSRYSYHAMSGQPTNPQISKFMICLIYRDDNIII